MKKCLTIVLILALGLVTAGCGKSEGRWVLIDSEFHEEEWYAELAESNKRNGFYQSEAQVSEGEFTWVYSYTGKDVKTMRDAHRFGDSITTQGSWTEPVKTVSGPEYEVSMRLKIETIDRNSEDPMQAGCFIEAEVPIPDDEGDGVIHSSLFADDGESSFRSDLDNGYVPIDVIVYGDMGKGETVGERRPLEVRVGLGYPPLMSYIYEWQE